MRILAGGITPDANEWEAGVARTVESLKELTKYVTSKKLTLNLENHMNSMARVSEETLGIVESVGSEKMGIIFDPANLRYNGEPDSETALERQVKWTRHVHAKDYRYFKSGKSFPVLVGKGDIPWVNLIKRLAKHGYNGYLSIEYEKRWRGDQLPDSALALRYDLRAVREMVRTKGT